MGLWTLTQTGGGGGGEGETGVILALRSSTTAFKEESSKDNAFTELFKADNSEDCATNLQRGHRKGSGKTVAARNAAFDSPAHPRCSHALHKPSHSIES